MGAEGGGQEILADSPGTWVLAPRELSVAWFTGISGAGIKDDTKGAGGTEIKIGGGWEPLINCSPPSWLGAGGVSV